MSKLTKSKLYGITKDIRVGLHDAFKKYKSTDDKAILASELKVESDKLLNLIEEINK